MCTRLQYLLDCGGNFAKSCEAGLSQMVNKLQSTPYSAHRYLTWSKCCSISCKSAVLQITKCLFFADRRCARRHYQILINYLYSIVRGDNLSKLEREFCPQKITLQIMTAKNRSNSRYFALFLLLSTLPVRHWRVYTEGRACSRCLPIA